MQLIVKGRNVEITDRIRNYVEKRASKLDRYLPDINEVRIDLSMEKTRSSQDRQAAQVTVRSNGAILRAEERADELFTAVDAVIEKIYRQIARYKGKREDRWHGQGPGRGTELEPLPLTPEALEELAEETKRRIVRTKRFMVAPMDEEEAIEQMELLGHDFFVFYNPNSGMLNVLYRRRDGNYGLLEPEVG
jgi:putative sigma-54 modulation protein